MAWVDVKEEDLWEDVSPSGESTVYKPTGRERDLAVPSATTDPLYSNPGAREIMQDRLLLGFGNEIKAAYKGATGDVPFQQGYDESMKASEALKASTPDNVKTRATIGGLLASGKGATALLNPKTMLGMTAEGTVLPAVEEFGAAKPGSRTEAGKSAGAAGLMGTLGLRGAEGILNGLTNVERGVKGIFVDSPPTPTMIEKLKGVTPKQLANEEAQMLVAQSARGGGRSLEQAAQRAEQLGPDATVMDALGNSAPSITGNIAKGSEEARRAIRKSGITDRLTGNVKGISEEVDKLTLDAIPATQTAVRQELKAVGTDIDNFVRGPEGKTLLPDQASLSSFLDKKINRGILNTARKNLEARTGRTHRAISQADPLTDADLIDVELAEEVKNVLQSRINKTKTLGESPDTVKNALAVDVRRQWDDLVDPNYPTGLQDLRKSYGELSKRNSAVNERFSKTIDEMYPGYKKGDLDEAIAGTEGKSLTTWWDKFKGKRAYSKVGAAGLIGNEVISSLMTPGISKAVKEEVVNIMLLSDDVPTFLRALQKSSISTKATLKIADKVKKAARLQRGIQYGQFMGAWGAAESPQPTGVLGALQNR